MSEFVHSVSLKTDKCAGCTHCIKSCPTEAIRVKDSKAYINSDRCIDCGECIRICPTSAKYAVYDPLSIIDDYKFKIALPAPALYGQFDNLDDTDYILNGLLKCGFDDVYEVARAAEYITEFTRAYLKKTGVKKPVISSACPVICRLISARFPLLRENVLPLLPPVELAAKIARKEALKNHPELKNDDIGVFFISPCPAKVSYIKQPIGIEKSSVDGVLAIEQIYKKLVSAMRSTDELKPLRQSGRTGISWAGTGGEASAIYNSKYLAADGVKNAIKVLEEIENENISGLEFVELNACHGGCFGGILTVENPYIAKARLHNLRRYLPVSSADIECNTFEDIPKDNLWTNPLNFSKVMQLSPDRDIAMQMLSSIQKIFKQLPGLDCGACGAPTCKAHAEDVVMGRSKEADCLFVMKEKINEIYKSFGAIASDIGNE